MTDKPHTAKQRAALHLLCERLADVLNEAGLNRRVVLEELANRGIDAEWSKDSVKELIWKPIQEVLTGFESTEENSTTSYDVTYQHLVRHFGTVHGITLPPWPSYYSQSLEDGE